MNIFDVKWDDLRTAYGFAHNVPYQIDRLKSSTQEDKVITLFHLRNEIFYQFTLYPVTVVAVRYLILLISDSDYNFKSQILELLSDIVKYANIQLKGNGFSKEYENLCQDNLHEIISNINVYIPLLSDKNPSLRMSVSQLLMQIINVNKNQYSSLQDKLRNALEYENSILVKVSMLFDCGKFDDEIGDLYQANEHALIQYASTLLLNRKNGITPTNNLRNLINIAIEFEDFKRNFFTLADYYDCMYHPLLKSMYIECEEELYLASLGIEDSGHFPWHEYVSLTTLVNLLTDVNLSEISRVYPALVFIVSKISSYNTHKIFPYIFNYLSILKDGLSTVNMKYPELTYAIYNNPFIWTDFYISSNLKVFEECGLPIERKIWRSELGIDKEIPYSKESATEFITHLTNIKLGRVNLSQPLSMNDYEYIKTLKLQNITNNNFVSLINHFKYLYELDISNSLIDGQAIANLLVFPELRILSLNGIILQDITITYISQLRNLERLFISNTNFHPDDARMLTSLHKLKLLVLKNTNIDEHDIPSIKKYIPDVRIII